MLVKFLTLLSDIQSGE